MEGLVYSSETRLPCILSFATSFENLGSTLRVYGLSRSVEPAAVPIGMKGILPASSRHKVPSRSGYFGKLGSRITGVGKSV